jgi:hypothetical protein
MKLSIDVTIEASKFINKYILFEIGENNNSIKIGLDQVFCKKCHKMININDLFNHVIEHLEANMKQNCSCSENHKLEFRYMFSRSPLIKDNIILYNIETVDKILDLYSQTNQIDHDFTTILDFSNWVVMKMKYNHGIGLVFPTKEMLALVFVVEEIYNVKSGWSRNISTGELEGDWIY